MRQRKIYQKLWKLVDDGGYTSTQVANATLAQLKQAVIDSGVSISPEQATELRRYWPSVQSNLVRRKQAEERDAEMRALGIKLKSQGLTIEEATAAVEAVYKLREEN